MIFFLIFAQNIDCRYTLEPPPRGGSNEYPQSMFWRKIRKKVHPCIPSFTIQKWGIRGYLIHGHVLLMKLILTICQRNSSLNIEYLFVIDFNDLESARARHGKCISVPGGIFTRMRTKTLDLITQRFSSHFDADWAQRFSDNWPI